MWSDIINHGQGSDAIDYSTVITLMPGVQIPEIMFESKITEYMDKQEPIYKDNFDDEEEVQNVKLKIESFWRRLKKKSRLL